MTHLALFPPYFNFNLKILKFFLYGDNFPMAITQERLIRIVDAAEHMADKHDELFELVRSLALMEPRTYLEYQKQLLGIVAMHSVDPEKRTLLRKETAHFRVHFKRNVRKRELLRLNRANPKRPHEDSVVDDYFKTTETAEEVSAELEIEQQRTVCPLCGESALSSENWRHKEDCAYWDSKEAGDAEVARRGEAGAL